MRRPIQLSDADWRITTRSTSRVATAHGDLCVDADAGRLLTAALRDSRRIHAGEKWKPYTVVDRTLYTGQNPASAAVLAERLLKALV